MWIPEGRASLQGVGHQGRFEEQLGGQFGCSRRRKEVVGCEVGEVMESQVLENLGSHCKHFDFNLSDVGRSWKGCAEE